MVPKAMFRANASSVNTVINFAIETKDKPRLNDFATVWFFSLAIVYRMFKNVEQPTPAQFGVIISLPDLELFPLSVFLQAIIGRSFICRRAFCEFCQS
jgi:hypothetical protein